MANAVRDTWALVCARSSAAYFRTSGPMTTWETSQRCPIIGLRCHSLATPSTGNAGRNRHESASIVSAPADIQGGDEVTVETPSGLNDELSVRTMSKGDRGPQDSPSSSKIAAYHGFRGDCRMFR